jgi:hypothetical protein
MGMTNVRGIVGSDAADIERERTVARDEQLGFPSAQGVE